MEIKTFGSWFVIIVMVASTIGFAVYFTERGNESTPSGSTTEEPSQTNIVSLSAQNIDAKAVEVLQKIVFSAGTDEAVKEDIDALVLKADGIEGFDSRYTQNNENSGVSGTLLYIAEISFNSNTTAEKLFKEINDNAGSILFDSSAHSLALVSLPKEVELINSDLNLTRKHSFNDLILSYVSIDTLKDDQLKISIEAGFDGNNVVNPVAWSTLNVTGSVKNLSLQLELPVKELFNEVSFYADINYSSYIKFSDENSLKQKLSSFSGVSGSNIEVLPAERIFSLSIDDNSFYLKSQDFNFMLSQDTGIKEFSFSRGEKFNAQISFNQDAKIDEVKNSISLMLSDLNVDKSKYSFIESRAAVSGDLNLSVEVEDFNASFISFLAANSFNSDSIELKQKALFDSNSFFDEASNSSYSYDQNSFYGLIDAGRKEGDLIKLLVYLNGYRGKALNVRAIEAPEEEIPSVQ